MKLSELKPEFVKLLDINGTMGLVKTLQESDGILFMCPVCFQARKGPVGTHSVLCWRPKVGPAVHPRPGRWEFEGTGIDDLSLVSGSSSILLNGGCGAHFFVRKGEIVLA